MNSCDKCLHKEMCDDYTPYNLNSCEHFINESSYKKKLGPMTKREEILEETKKCICQDRNAQYGEPEDNFAAIAKLWTDYLGVGITPHDVGIMMTLFKIARIKSGGRKDDNYIDACGYMACAAEIAAKEEHYAEVH